MADKKISALTSLAQGDVAASTDVLPIVDTSATETKKVTAAALVGAGMTAGVTNVDINSGSIDGTTIGANSAAAGTFTTLTGTTKVVSPYVDAVGSAGGQLRNASGTSQLAWGAGGGSNLSLEVATNINPANAAVSIAPTGTGTVTINPATAGTMNNVAIGGTTAAAGSFTTLTTSSTVTLNGGTANGVLYLNASKVATSGSAFVFDGTNVGIGTASPDANFKLDVQAATGRVKLTSTTGTNSVVYQANNTGGTLNVGIDSSTGGSLFGVGAYAAGVWYSGNYPLVFGVNNAEGFRLTSTSLYTASGINVGIGTSSPTEKLHVAGALRVTGAQTTAGTGVYLDQTSGTGGVSVYGPDNSTQGTFRIYTATANGGTGSTKLTLDSSGNLGIGTSSPTQKLDVNGTSRLNGVLISTDGTYSSPYVTVGFSGLTNGKTRIFGTTNDSDNLYLAAGTGRGINFWVNGSTANAMLLDSSGNLGLGVTPSAWGSIFRAVQVGTGGSIFGRSSGNQDVFQMGANVFWDGSNWKYIGNGASTRYEQATGTHVWSYAASGTAGNTITFTEAMTLNASGNLGIGTSSPDQKLVVTGQQRILSSAQSFTATGKGLEFFYSSSDEIGYIQSYDRAASLYKDLRLRGNVLTFTSGVGTESARITSGGYSKFSNNGTYVGATGAYHEMVSDGTGNTLVVRNSSTSTDTDGTVFISNARNTTDNTYYILSAYNTTAVAFKFRVADSGNVTNTNGSYGTISDFKMKTDIVDAGSQWDDVKALRFRKFKMKDDPSGLTQLGVVAQEVEQVSPGLVEEHADRDAEGNDLGTTTKSVKTSVLLMKAAVALQEAMTRIEQLEAKVAALESK